MRDLREVLGELEAKERLLDVHPPGDDPVLLQEHDVVGVDVRPEGLFRRGSGRSEGDEGHLAPQAHHALRQKTGQRATRAGQGGRVRRVRVHDRAHVAPEAVHEEVQADLAEGSIASANHAAALVDDDELIDRTEALGKGRRRRHHASGRGQRGDVAVVIGDPAALPDDGRRIGDLAPQLMLGLLAHLTDATSMWSMTPTITLRMGSLPSIVPRICRAPLPS